MMGHMDAGAPLLGISSAEDESHDLQAIGGRMKEMAKGMTGKQPNVKMPTSQKKKHEGTDKKEKQDKDASGKDKKHGRGKDKDKDKEKGKTPEDELKELLKKSAARNAEATTRAMMTKMGGFVFPAWFQEEGRNRLAYLLHAFITAAVCVGTFEALRAKFILDPIYEHLRQLSPDGARWHFSEWLLWMNISVIGAHVCFGKALFDCGFRETRPRFRALRHACVSVFMLVLFLYMGTWIACNNNEKPGQAVRHAVKYGLKQYSEDAQMKAVIDKIHMLYQCCANEGWEDFTYLEWQNPKYKAKVIYEASENITEDLIMHTFVPFSCCNTSSVPPCIHRDFDAKYRNPSLYNKGCGDIILTAITQFISETRTIYLGIMMLLEVFIIVIARYLQTNIDMTTADAFGTEEYMVPGYIFNKWPCSACDRWDHSLRQVPPIIVELTEAKLDELEEEIFAKQAEKERSKFAKTQKSPSAAGSESSSPLFSEDTVDRKDREHEEKIQKKWEKKEVQREKKEEQEKLKAEKQAEKELEKADKQKPKTGKFKIKQNAAWRRWGKKTHK